MTKYQIETDLNKLTRKYTAFESFDALCNDPYTPTIRVDGRGGTEKAYLAGAYDYFQPVAGRDKKSYR